MNKIEDKFTEYCKNKQSCSLKERTLMEAYRECVLQNDDTIGNFKLVDSLTEMFQRILNDISLNSL